jgi:pyruvate/2-oxoacid:ferredoxin oxidoreductase beta subunit
MDEIMIAHRIPYIATATAAYPHDLIAKFKKARSMKGMRYIHVLSSCPPGWRIPENMSIEIMRLAVLSNIFPLYEVENTETFRQTVIPDKVESVEKYLRSQGRFKHLTEKNIRIYQREITARFRRLKERFERVGT